MTDSSPKHAPHASGIRWPTADELVDAFRKWEANHRRDEYGRFDSWAASFRWLRSFIEQQPKEEGRGEQADLFQELLSAAKSLAYCTDEYQAARSQGQWIEFYYHWMDERDRRTQAVKVIVAKCEQRVLRQAKGEKVCEKT